MPRADELSFTLNVFDFLPGRRGSNKRGADSIDQVAWVVRIFKRKRNIAYSSKVRASAASKLMLVGLPYFSEVVLRDQYLPLSRALTCPLPSQRNFTLIEEVVPSLALWKRLKTSFWPPKNRERPAASTKLNFNVALWESKTCWVDLTPRTGLGPICLLTVKKTALALEERLNWQPNSGFEWA